MRGRNRREKERKKEKREREEGREEDDVSECVPDEEMYTGRGSAHHRIMQHTAPGATNTTPVTACAAAATTANNTNT